LGEIGSTFKKSETEALKAFLSKSEDELRRPYGATFNKYQRRTAFFGTVNDIKFLQDSTNNRRFWPIEVSSVNYQHNIDMQQVWAECEYLAEQGEISYLTQAENQMIAIHNETFKAVDPIEELIRSNYDFEGCKNLRRVTCTDIAIEIGYRHPSKSQVSNVGKVLQNMEIKCTSSKGLSRYYMPHHKANPYVPDYLFVKDDFLDLV
jgi:predicted P-loop ATPase